MPETCWPQHSFQAAYRSSLKQLQILPAEGAHLPSSKYAWSLASVIWFLFPKNDIKCSIQNNIFRPCGAGHHCPPPQCHPQEGACLGRMFTQWLVNSFTTNTNNSNAKFGGFGKGNWVTGASCLWSLPSPLHLINWRAGVNLMKQEDAGLRTQTLRNPSHKNLW